MKFIFSLLAILMLSKECENKNSSSSDDTTKTETTNKMQEEITITYEANTRGFYEKIWITNETLNYSNDRKLKSVNSSMCSENDWDELMALLKKVDLQKLPELEAPSKKFQFDGAAMTTLTIANKDGDLKTPLFDHDNPPKTIAALVKKMLSMKEIAQKG